MKFLILESARLAGRPAGHRHGMTSLIIAAAISSWLSPVPANGSTYGSSLYARASFETRSLCYALLQYELEYDRFPFQDHSGRDHDYSNEWAHLSALLRCDTNFPSLELEKHNPRQKHFLDVKESSVLTNGIVDPWDHPYRVVADWDGDGSIVVGMETVKESVVSWSIGENGKDDGAQKDDIPSWREWTRTAKEQWRWILRRYDIAFVVVPFVVFVALLAWAFKSRSPTPPVT